MAAYTKQTWDTTSIFNPTRMNHIEEGIYDASTNIVDNLTSTDATSALSAYQGKVLNEKIKTVDASVSSNAQGVANLGTNYNNKKILSIYSPNNQYICLSFSSPITGGFGWYVKILGFYNLSPVEANDISLKIVYID